MAPDPALLLVEEVLNTAFVCSVGRSIWVLLHNGIWKLRSLFSSVQYGLHDAFIFEVLAMIDWILDHAFCNISPASPI